MSVAIERRLSRLEGRSPWGSKADLAATPFLVMHVPEGGETDRRVAKARERALASGQYFRCTSSPAAMALPVWLAVPLERIPDELLSDMIAEVQAVAA